MSARLAVWVQPGASRSRVVGMRGDALKVCVSAPPEKGRANKALEAFLAGALGLKKSAVRVVSGKASRQKVVEIEGLDDEALRQALGEKL